MPHPSLLTGTWVSCASLWERFVVVEVDHDVVLLRRDRFEVWVPVVDLYHVAESAAA
jgi:hypothetical protein